MNNEHMPLRILFIAVVFALASFLNIYAEEDNVPQKANKSLSKTNESGKQGTAYRLDVNNINITINNRGLLASPDIPPDGSEARFANGDFLFYAGMQMSGYANNNLWAFQAASQVRSDGMPGLESGHGTDPRAVLYVVNKEDEPFGKSWVDWKDAVDQGADYYDGDGDGTYNPVDLNSNGVWDPEEDMPDLLGDETVWQVFHDGLPASDRHFPGIDPVGIEVRLTVFAFASKGPLGNIIFLRYKVRNTGLTTEELEDVHFAVLTDPDLGRAQDDMGGCDVERNVAFAYNNGDDAEYGQNPPSFIVDFFSGPASFIPSETFTDNNGNGLYDEGIDTPIDTAHNYRGQLLGVRNIPGAKNLGITSMFPYQTSDPQIGDPINKFECRNYHIGLDKTGNLIDPCTFAYGSVLGGVDCSTIDPKFLYSGDPVKGEGWVNNVEKDKRLLMSTGPFDMRKGEDVEIVVAYVCGQGTDPLSSITEVKRIDEGAQIIFDKNFAAPSTAPSVKSVFETNDDFIDIKWDTPQQVSYSNMAEGAWDLRFEGYNVYAYKTNSTQELVDNQPNSMLVTRYDADNFIKDIYKENIETGGIELLYPSQGNSLNTDKYSNPETGKIRLRITKDPFTGKDLIKGKTYYFAVTSYLLNYDGLLPHGSDMVFGDNGDYYLSSKAFVGEVENIPKIFKVVVGENVYLPPNELIETEKVAGGSKGKLMYDVINDDELTGDKYEVTFKVDSTSEEYKAFWTLKNSTTNSVLIDSSNNYGIDENDLAFPVTDGFIVKISDEEAELGEIQIQTVQDWINQEVTKYYYLAPDIEQSSVLSNIQILQGKKNDYVLADQLRRVVLKFGEAGKAYRYLNGFIGNTSFQKKSTWTYAEAVTADDTIGAGIVGQLGSGFVDVPFTAWIEDFNFGETRQLAVGFLEASSNLGGNPDGIWNPGTSLDDSHEYIFLFNSTYDPSGNQTVYKGGFPDGDKTVWADMRGYEIPISVTGVNREEIKMAKSPFFNTLYCLGIQRTNDVDFYSQGDNIVIPISNYPYTSNDKFTFTTVKDGALSADEEKALFEKVNVFPNPLFGYNTATSSLGESPDDPFVTFSNLPPDNITINIYSIAGLHIRTLTSDDKDYQSSPFLRWDLQNEDGLRAASGLYIAIVISPKHGEKILKFYIVMPQKQVPRY